MFHRLVCRQSRSDVCGSGSGAATRIIDRPARLSRAGSNRKRSRATPVGTLVTGIIAARVQSDLGFRLWERLERLVDAGQSSDGPSAHAHRSVDLKARDARTSRVVPPGALSPADARMRRATATSSLVAQFPPLPTTR